MNSLPVAVLQHVLMPMLSCFDNARAVAACKLLRQLGHFRPVKEARDKFIADIPLMNQEFARNMVDALLARCMSLILPERGGALSPVRPTKPMFLEVGDVRRYGITWNQAFVVAQILLHARPGTVAVHYATGSRAAELFVMRVRVHLSLQTLRHSEKYQVTLERGTHLYVRTSAQRGTISTRSSRGADLVMVDNADFASRRFIEETFNSLITNDGAIGILVSASRDSSVKSMSLQPDVVNIDPTPAPCQRHRKEMQAHASIKKAQEKNLRDSAQGRREAEIKVGDKVWLRNVNMRLSDPDRARKLEPLYFGPYEAGSNAAELKLPEGCRLFNRFNLDLLKLYVDGSVGFPDREVRHGRNPPVVEEDPERRGPASGELVYEVEAIVQKRRNRAQNRTEYLVKWLGWPQEQNSWLPKEELEDCTELLEEYEAQIDAVRRRRAQSVAVEFRRQEERDTDFWHWLTAIRRKQHTKIARAVKTGRLGTAEEIAEAERQEKEDAEWNAAWARKEEANRERARAAASETKPIPPGVVYPPTTKGEIRMGSQGCIAKTKSGEWCKQRTQHGEYCWVHLGRERGVRIKDSSIAGAGKGLWAHRAFKKGEEVARYTGDLVPVQDEYGGSAYVLELTKTVAIDAARTNAAEGRMINDARGSLKGKNNARFCCNQRTKTAILRATRDIEAGEELFVSYGGEYFNKEHAAVAGEEENTSGDDGYSSSSGDDEGTAWIPVQRAKKSKPQAEKKRQTTTAADKTRGHGGTREDPIPVSGVRIRINAMRVTGGASAGGAGDERDRGTEERGRRAVQTAVLQPAGRACYGMAALYRGECTAQDMLEYGGRDICATGGHCPCCQPLVRNGDYLAACGCWSDGGTDRCLGCREQAAAGGPDLSTPAAIATEAALNAQDMGLPVGADDALHAMHQAQAQNFQEAQGRRMGRAMTFGSLVGPAASPPTGLTAAGRAAAGAHAEEALVRARRTLRDRMMEAGNAWECAGPLSYGGPELNIKRLAGTSRGQDQEDGEDAELCAARDCSCCMTPPDAPHWDVCGCFRAAGDILCRSCRQAETSRKRDADKVAASVKHAGLQGASTLPNYAAGQQQVWTEFTLEGGTGAAAAGGGSSSSSSGTKAKEQCGCWGNHAKTRWDHARDAHLTPADKIRRAAAERVKAMQASTQAHAAGGKTLP